MKTVVEGAAATGLAAYKIMLNTDSLMIKIKKFYMR